MKKEYSKYFWNLNKRALEEVEAIFKNPKHPKFNMYMATFLSRCQNPKEFFALVKRGSFIKFWPQVKKYWKKIAPDSTFIDWWQTVYEQLLEQKGIAVKKRSGSDAPILKKIGQTLKKVRLEKGLSQKEVALKSGMKQPDISKIEEGKKNITLVTLAVLCEVLGIKNLDL